LPNLKSCPACCYLLAEYPENQKDIAVNSFVVNV